MGTVIYSPAIEVAEVQSRFISNTVNIIHPDGRWEIASSKLAISDSTNGIFKTKHPESENSIIH